MKISLVTVSYNSEATIEETIKSVLKQNYDNYEYIIKDGKSTDKTLEIIMKYEKKFKGKLKVISTKDKGIYDAMNIGVKEATGDIIGLLNSDDILYSEDAFKIIASSFKKDIDGVYSNLMIRDYDTMTTVVRSFIPKTGNYKLGWFPPHPTLYLRREVYDKFGYFDTSFKIAADYDFMLRIMRGNVKLKYIDKELINMRANGISTNGLKGYKKSFDESIIALKNNNIKFPYLINIFRSFKVLFQSLSKYKEIIMYLIFGVLTTVIALTSYYILTATILNAENAVELQIANILSWIVGVLFAFFTNKKFVFESKNNAKVEFPKFVGARIVTLLMDMLVMFIGVTLLAFNHKIMKLLAEVIVIVSNYIFSKLFVFKK